MSLVPRCCECDAAISYLSGNPFCGDCDKRYVARFAVTIPPEPLDALAGGTLNLNGHAPERKEAA